MVSEPNTRRCANLLAVPRGGVPVKTLGPKGRGGGFGGGSTSIGGKKECQRGRWAPEGGLTMMSHIGWGVEQTAIYKGVEAFS